jgi:CheY-like chemotaxis protein
MSIGLRVLVVAPLHRIITPVLERALPGAVVTAVGAPKQALTAVRGRVRHDLALVDLLWNDREHEYKFDGLDVLSLLRLEDRHAPVVLAVQGHGFEHAHLAEAIDDDLVKGVYQKSSGPEKLVEAIELASSGRRLPENRFPSGRDARLPIHEYFKGRRGTTAARLAAAIASGRTWDSRSLADLAGVPLNTANKLVYYLEPLIEARGEVPDTGRVTVGVVHRWCGENARYLMSTFA